MHPLIRWVGVLSSALILAGTSTALFAQEVRGAGATFPAAVYLSWAFGFSKEKQIEVGYKPLGSGEGIRLISSHEVDFGASDSALPPDDTQKLGLMKFPTIVGGIVPSINVKGIGPGTLKLTGALLAEIFAGRITRWDDARIVAINPGLALPPQAIVRIVRADGSGTTEAFTKYLGVVSPAWQREIGSGKTVHWPGDVTAVDGTDAVAQTLRKTPGGIGYVSYDRVMRDKLVYALLQNRSGRFVEPSEFAFRETIKASDLVHRGDETASLLNLSGTDVWPIVNTTYILVDVKPSSAERASRVLSFFYWAFLKGDEILSGTGFAPLPSELQARIVRKLAEVRPGDGGALQLLRASSDLVVADARPQAPTTAIKNPS